MSLFPISLREVSYCWFLSAPKGPRGRGAGCGEEVKELQKSTLGSHPLSQDSPPHLGVLKARIPWVWEEGRGWIPPLEPRKGAQECSLQEGAARAVPALGWPLLPAEPGSLPQSSRALAGLAQGPHRVGTGLGSAAARGFPWQGAQIIKAQPASTAIPSFHQLSSPILCFLFFWESSALFNKKKGLPQSTRELMIDSDIFNNSVARQALSTHSTQRMPWRRTESCKGLLLGAEAPSNKPTCLSWKKAPGNELIY